MAFRAIICQTGLTWLWPAAGEGGGLMRDRRGSGPAAMKIVNARTCDGWSTTIGGS